MFSEGSAKVLLEFNANAVLLLLFIRLIVRPRPVSYIGRCVGDDVEMTTTNATKFRFVSVLCRFVSV